MMVGDGSSGLLPVTEACQEFYAHSELIDQEIIRMKSDKVF